MIDFIAHDFWSAAWLALLVCAGLVAVLSGHKPARRILVCFVLNWMCTRSLVAWAHDNDLLWIILDSATVAALVMYGQSRSALAVAVLFFLILVIDNLTAWGGVNFSQAAAASDLLGAIGLLIMAGAKNVDGGKLQHAKHYRFGFGGLGGRGGGAGLVAGGRSISARPGMSGASLDGGQSVVP